MTINADATATVTGTATAEVVFTATLQKPRVVFPAGTYSMTNRLFIGATTIDNVGLGNKFGPRFTVDVPFLANYIKISYAKGATLNQTIPLNIFWGSEIPDDLQYHGNSYTVDFGRAIAEGEYNWSTGELKDADGNTVSYYNKQQVMGLTGENILWTGFGEVTASNKSDEGLDKVVILLNESAPEGTISSICDFTLTPTTMQAAYGIAYTKFMTNGAVFQGREVPLLTTKGTLEVRDSDEKVKYSKYINPIINHRNVSDLLTEKGLHKAWSEKFYLNATPVNKVLADDYSSTKNITWTWEFTEDDFANTGIPAKLDDIPLASPCFDNDEGFQGRMNGRVYFSQPYPAKFSYNAETGKYTLVARGVYDSISHQLTIYSKVHFYYQLETPYDITDGFAMGISAGDYVSFTEDYTDAQDFIDDGGIYHKPSSNTLISKYNIAPTLAIEVPRNVNDAMNGMENAARMLNMSGTAAGGDVTVQGYSWIGAGDGTTDYTTQIQNKINEIHSVTNGGTIYLGPGVYKISNSLIVYDNTRIIGDGQTVIEQTADNTHAVIWSGSNIVMRDLTIKLSGVCTELTGCIFVNSNNGDNIVGNGGRDERYPKNMYVSNCSASSVTLIGTYRLSYQDDEYYLSEEALAYRGVGVLAGRLFFNYFDADNLICKNLYSGVCNGGGSNNYRLYVTESRFAVYGSDGNNRYEIKGHTYYGTGNKSVLGATDYIVYSNGTYNIFDVSGFYDTQHTKAEVCFTSKSMGNICYTHSRISELMNTTSTTWEGNTTFVDYGRNNEIICASKNMYLNVGNRHRDITNQTSYNKQLSPTVDNALAGAGVWGVISSNTQWTESGIKLADVCRYPKNNLYRSNNLGSVISTLSPSKDTPIEIVINISDRPICGYPSIWIQFDHRFVAQDLTVSFDTTNNGNYNFVRELNNNVESIVYWLNHQAGNETIYRIKISITKALVIPELTYVDAGHNDYTINYNPDGLVGIVNIGMPHNDAYGRAFLGECGGSLYGSVDMHQNTLKNLPDPIEAGDAVSKAYVDAQAHNITETEIEELLALIK